MVKRLFDIVVSLTVLLLILPFCLLIALVLALTGEGEIFFPQARVGRGGRLFKLLKFATMLKDSPNIGTGTVTVADDPRVLPIGKILRKSKLNELPQLLNVLKGDMSLVGPRPLTEQVIAYYPDEVREKILQVAPGVTGLGSIAFRDEESIFEASKLSAADCWRHEIAPYKGSLEVWYVDHQSFWLDLKLLVLTVVAVVSPRSQLHERVIPGAPPRADFS